MNKRLVSLFLAVFLGLSCFQADSVGSQIPCLPAKTVHAQENVDSTVDKMLVQAKSNQPELSANVSTGTDSWTVAVYMCGSDLERDQGAGTRDLCEMLHASLSDNVNLIVLTGGTGRDLWNPHGKDEDGTSVHPGYVEPHGTQIWQITDTEMNLLYDYDKAYQDLSDSSVAEAFFKFAAAYAPADHMMVEFWDHGGGPIKGAEFALQDDGSDIGFMSLNSAVSAVKKANDYRKQMNTAWDKFDLVGFDCCLMGSVETAYAISTSADYMVASEEKEPIDGWNYFWLNILGETRGQGLSDRDQAEKIGTRIVDLYSADKIIDKTDFTSLGDVEKAKKIWQGRSQLFSEGTLALIDLSGMDDVMAAMNEFGKALKAIYNHYVEDDGEEWDAAFHAVTKAAEDVPYLSYGTHGQVDIYLMAKELSEKNITEDLTRASDNLIRTVGDGSSPAPQMYTEHDKISGKDEQVPGGQIGAPAGNGVVKYRGSTYNYVNCAGLAMFYPATLKIESVYLDAVTGKNRTQEEYHGIYNGNYVNLDFAKSGLVDDYMEYVGIIAGLQDTSRDFGASAGYIQAEVDDQTNTIYMTHKNGDVAKLVSVISEIGMESSDGAFYLGFRKAEYNEDKDRYEVSDQHRWLSVNGVPVTYEDMGFGERRIPVVIEKEDGQGRYAEGKYHTGDTVARSDICYLYINPEDAAEGQANVEKWYDPHMNQSHDTSGNTAAVIRFRPLRQEMTWDEENGVYVRGDYIACDRAETKVDKIMEDEWDFSITYIENVELKKPSEETSYLIGYSFKAYDLNTAAYTSNQVYELEVNWSKLNLSIDPIRDQTWTGKIIRPNLTFSLSGLSGITLENLKKAFPGVDIEVTYTNNEANGTGKAVVTVKDKGTGEILKVMEKGFKITNIPRKTSAKRKANRLKVKKKTVKIRYSKLRKKAQKIKAARIRKGNSARTKIRYKLIKASKKKKAFTVTPAGAIKIKKGTKKGKYKLTIRATAAKSRKYRSAKKNFTVIIKIY